MQQQFSQVQQSHEVYDAQWDYYAKRVATAGSDGVVRIYAYLSDKPDEENMRLIAEAKGHEAAVWKVSWSSPKFSGGLLASCGYDRRVIIWRESRPNIWERAYVYEGHELSINSLAFAPFQFGLVLASASSDGTVSLLLSKEGDWSIQRFMAHHTGVNSISWAPYKNHAGSNRPFQEGPQTMRIATAGCDGLVKIWRLEHGQFLCEEALQSNVGGVNSWARVVAWSPVNDGLIASAQGNTVLLWQQADRAGWQSRTLSTFSHEVVSLSWSQQGSDAAPALLAVATAGGDVSLWQPKSARGGATAEGYPPASPLLEGGGSGRGRDAGWECISGPQASSSAPGSGSAPGSTSAPGSGPVPQYGNTPSPSPSPPVSSGPSTNTVTQTNVF